MQIGDAGELMVEVPGLIHLKGEINVLQSVILTDGEKMTVTPTYWVMEMYTVHHDAVRLPLEIRSDVYTLGGRSLPAVSASASRDGSGTIHVSLVNIDPGRARDVDVDLRGASARSVRGRILSSPRMQDHNTFDDPGRVKPADFSGARLDGSHVRVQVPPCAVVVLSLQSP